MITNKLKLILAAACLLGYTNNIAAQATIYEATRVTGSDLNGTARYVGMGGAMGALGGDITTMSTNPAGIGIYRSSDAMISFGVNGNEVTSKYGHGVNKTSNTFGSFDNAGFVYSYKVGNNTPVRFVNFGFNYRKSKSFDRNVNASGTYGSSLTEQMADMTASSGASVSSIEASNAYSNSSIPWLGVLGYDSYLVNPSYDSNNALNGYSSYYAYGDEVDGVYKAKERGGVHDFDFNVAFNVRDRIYFGATLGTHYLDYTRTSTYSEDFYNDNTHWGGYDLNNYYNVTGGGVDFKVGVIVRPIEDSPLRVGLAIHTPTLYRLTEYGSASISYDVYNDGDEKTGTTYTQDASGYDMESETEYKAVTPWKYNLSVGYTVGSSVALGAEYEYADYSTCKLKYDDGEIMNQETADAGTMLNGVHTIKLGAEFKIIPEFAFRVGYNHISAAMKTDAFKWLPSYSVRTDADYSNLRAVNNYTLGIGYRGSSFYADMAFVYNAAKEQLHTFYACDENGKDISYDNLTKVNNKNSKVVFTLGMRF